MDTPFLISSMAVSMVFIPSLISFRSRNRSESELEMLPFHEGSFKIATKTGCPIIPIAIHNSAEIFEAHSPKIRPCKVVVEYGDPIYPEQLSKEEKKRLGSYTQNIILEMLKKNQTA